MFHIPTWQGLRLLLPKLEMPFARLMIMWFVAFIVISAVLTMLPLALIRVFGVSTGLPATTYAFAAAASLATYPLAARMSKHGEIQPSRQAEIIRGLAGSGQTSDLSVQAEMLRKLADQMQRQGIAIGTGSQR